MTSLTSYKKAYMPMVLSPEQGLKEEMELLDQVVTKQLEGGFKIWCCEKSIVVPKSLSRKPGFDRAVQTMAGLGWPVVIRQTGGDLVPQSPGLLNVTLVFKRKKRKGSIKETYEALCLPLIEALKSMGIDAGCSSIPGSFCDGDYNLVVGRQKLAGTAQRWRRVESAGKEEEFAVLVHAVILCSNDLPELWRVTNEFYSQCDIDQYVEYTKHVSVAGLVGEKQTSETDLLEVLSLNISRELELFLSK